MGALHKAGIGFDDYVSHDALGLAELVRPGETDAVELMETAIARAEAVNPKINAIAHKLYETGRKTAAITRSGSFAGVPWVMKDIGHPIAGVPLTSGSRSFADAVSSKDAEKVRRFRAAGLVIFATSTTPEFGLTVTTESKAYGLTRNPWNLEHSSGGSSGGSAALVAAGVLPAAHATDGGGSIRVPASCCGLFGLKPSRGRSPVGHGRTEGWNGLGVSHAVTRSVRDSAALLDATHGGELGSRYAAPPAPEGGFLAALARKPGRLRIALAIEAATGVAVDPECRAAAEQAAKLCESLGHHVEVARPALDARALGGAMGLVIAAHTAATIDGREQALGRRLREDELEQSTWGMVENGRRAKATELIAADNAFMAAAIAVARFQERWDLILSPVLARPPAKIGELSLDQPLAEWGAAIGAYSAYTALQNQTGQPAMSVPLHWTAAGLPVGVQFAARYGDEALLLQLAAQLEQAQPWFGRRAAL